MTTPSSRSLKMAKFNLVKNFTSLWKMIIFCNCHLNLNNFLIVCHKATFQENLMGFKFEYSNSNMTSCYEIGHHFIHVHCRGHMFIMHFGRHNN